MEQINEELKEEIFLFLDIIRDSGEINMFGARPYIQEEFDLSKKEAGKYLSLYLKQKQQ